jgi:uncharacterized protein (DUF3084 family)
MTAASRSGEWQAHACRQDDRLSHVETSVADHEVRIRGSERALSDGDTRFTRLEGKLESVSESLKELSESIKGAVRWVLGIVATGAAGAIGWAFVQSQRLAQ